MQELIVKVRNARGHRFIAIPRQIADNITVSYLRVRMDNGRLIYSPVRPNE